MPRTFARGNGPERPRTPQPVRYKRARIEHYGDIWRASRIGWADWVREGAEVNPPRPIQAVCEHLLTRGGDYVNLSMSGFTVNILAPALAERGTFFDQTGMRFCPGSPNGCLGNALGQLCRHPETLKLVLGFSLDDHRRMWRDHAWNVDAEGRILECTWDRASVEEHKYRYYGVVLTAQESVGLAEHAVAHLVGRASHCLLCGEVVTARG
jgi:hypothetical protein